MDEKFISNTPKRHTVHVMKDSSRGHKKGPLAHLVERIHGMDEASGSSPLWSTNKNFFLFVAESKDFSLLSDNEIEKYPLR